MWTITDKQIKDISESVKREVEKLITKYSPTDKSDSVADDNRVSQQVSTQESTDNKSVNQINSSDVNHSDNSFDSAKGKSNNKNNNTKSTDDIILPCEEIEVDFIAGEIPEANNEEFEAALFYINNEKEEVEEKFENQVVKIDVLSKVHMVARYLDGNKIESNKVEWYIKKGTEKEIELKSLPEIIGDSETKKLTGSEIYFPAPKEWGKKTYTVIAVRKDLNVKKTIQLTIKDHIAAAFFRLEPRKYETQNISIKEKLGGIPLKDLYHHQGLYREGNTFYISVSTFPSVPSYIYISGDKKGQIMLDKGALSQYTHPGGIQVADGLLAVGLEKYTGIPFSTEFISVICFFDLKKGNKELTDLRLILDEGYNEKIKINTDRDVLNNAHNQTIRNNRASALGIVKRGNEFIVANRGTNSNIDFYKIDSDKKNITQIGNTFKGVGDFQNINLFLYKNDVYLFGMGNENGKTGGITYVYHVFVNPKKKRKIGGLEEFDMEEIDQTKIDEKYVPYDTDDSPFNTFKEYRKRDKDIYDRLENQNIPYGKYVWIDYVLVYGSYYYDDFDKKVIVYKYMIEDTEIVPHNVCRIFKLNDPDSDPSLESVWIDNDGYLKTQLYDLGEVNNKIRFYCQEETDPRFHWASCLHLGDSNMDLEAEEENGFERNFTLYAVGAGVSNKKISSIFFKEKEEK